jgi:protein TonB
MQNQFMYAFLEDDSIPETFSESTYDVNIDNHMIAAEFPGGSTEMYKFIGHHIVYPNSSKYSGSQGTVYVYFIVEKDGNISNIQIVKGVDEAIDKEVIIVVDKMPNWIPAKNINGEDVRCGIQIPVKFSLVSVE